MKTLLILNDAPMAASARTTARAWPVGWPNRKAPKCASFIGDAAAAAHVKQKVPAGFYNLEVMLGAVVRHQGVIGVRHLHGRTRHHRRGSRRGSHRSSLDELTQWTTWADKVLVFLNPETNMFFRQRPAANATLSYFFGCTGIGKSVAVDVVAGDEDWFIAEAAKVGVPISYVIDTPRARRPLLRRARTCTPRRGTLRRAREQSRAPDFRLHAAGRRPAARCRQRRRRRAAHAGPHRTASACWCAT